MYKEDVSGSKKFSNSQKHDYLIKKAPNKEIQGHLKKKLKKHRRKEHKR